MRSRFNLKPRSALKLLSNIGELARLIELRCVRPDATRADIQAACDAARKHSYHGVCVNSGRVELACALLEETEIKTIACIGYPFGAMDADAKRYETEAAIDLGAQEIEVVLNIGMLKDGEDARLLRELRDIVEAAEERPVSVVIECGLLSRDEKIRACGLIVESDATAVSVATVLDTNPPQPEEIKFLREHLDSQFGLKASWNDLDEAMSQAFLEAGATRLVTS
jgi:deoxyribose-phosphate aldolase